MINGSLINALGGTLLYTDRNQKGVKLMNKSIMKFVFLIAITFPICVLADATDEASPENNSETKPETEYLSQDQVTREDYNTMTEFEISYDECMQETSRAEVANYNDPRHVVDVAMKQCAVKLEELNAWFTEKRFPPSFKQGYIRKISGHTVRQVMPQVMFMMSRKQQ